MEIEIRTVNDYLKYGYRLLASCAPCGAYGVQVDLQRLAALGKGGKSGAALRLRHECGRVMQLTLLPY